MNAVRELARQFIWYVARRIHRYDYALFLPLIARMPFAFGYRLATLRGHFNYWLGRDWRSMALGFRHIKRQSRLGYKLLPLNAADSEVDSWTKQRFIAESHDEYDACLIAARRVDELACKFTPGSGETICAQVNAQRGLVLLATHFESFFIGIAFLARSGATVNTMSAAVYLDPRVDIAVRNHFENKYRGMEHYSHGGKVVNMEDGLRDYYRMLQRKETLIVLADAPVLPDGAAMSVNFLGELRDLAGGALRIARATNSDLGGFKCRCVGPGKYELELCSIGPANDPKTIDSAYDFFSQSIMSNPGSWWAADLLPHMPPSKKKENA